MLQAEVKEYIAERYQSLNLDTVLQNPEADLVLFADELTQEIIDKFGKRFILEGLNFADEVIKKRTPVIYTDSTDPKANKDAVEIQGEIK